MVERKTVRCAIYTRKSTEFGLEQDFNSLDAQQEACEAYIKSQAHEGWKLLPAKYDDGGISGATLERAALQTLLEDVKARKIDVKMNDGRIAKAITLRVNGARGPWVPPAAYGRLITEGAVEANLPADYRANLNAIVAEAQRGR